MDFRSKVINLFKASKQRPLNYYQLNPRVYDLFDLSGKLEHDLKYEVNRDYQKRDRLLDIRVNWLKEAEDNGGIEEFEGMNVKTLEELLLNGFILPWHCQNASPTVAEILRFMAKYPQILASGYAVSPFREDYRVAIDGIYVDRDDVSSQLREDFIDFCESASELLTNDDLNSWWD